MKVLIDNKPEQFISITWAGNHYQCNTTGNRTAHCFNMHPDTLPKDKEIKTNGHTYIFPSKPKF